MLLVVILMAGSTKLAAQPDGSGGEGNGDLLLLVTETFERPDDGEDRVRYWWSNPEDPQWTETDAALERALRETDAAAMTPPNDVRISRIYRTPDLSLDNAASLASLLGARRIVLGEVSYEPTTTSLLPDHVGLKVKGTLQVVDVTSSEPSVIRTLEIERSVFGRARTKEASGEQAHPLAERARQRFSTVVGGLLDRTVVAASGEIGVASEEPLLSFRDLRRGRALELVREFLGGLDTVEATRVRWASEGRIAVEINPDKRDELDSVRYAARTLVNHKFERMRVRRAKEAEKSRSRIAFAVELDDDFDEPRRRDEEPKDDE